MRNCIKQADNGRKAITEKDDLTVNELLQIRSILEKSANPNEGIMNVITTAFYMGYAVAGRKP